MVDAARRPVMPAPPTAARRSLVLCADDFAQDEGCTEAIVRLAAAGRLTATSAMVLSPRWQADASRLAPLRDRLDVGLHLDWTSPFALAAGHGRPLGALMLAALAGRIDPRQARGEIERQLDAFEAAWGAPPDHVDGHQHVHQFAGIREPLVQVLAARWPGERRPWLRISRPVGAGRGAKSALITLMGAGALSRLATAAGLPHGAVLGGVYDFQGDVHRYAGLMGQWLAGSPDHAVLMCHPAAAPAPGDGIAAARIREFAVLSTLDPSVHQVRLARGRDLFASP
jgi:predicted glycoside hydrolase/deacetylase ChbG (UPF0249 family)